MNVLEKVLVVAERTDFKIDQGCRISRVHTEEKVLVVFRRISTGSRQGDCGTDRVIVLA
jgi:hypothetical protein